jgi:hypothetical protein
MQDWIVSELQHHVLSYGVHVDYVLQYGRNLKQEDAPLGFSSYDGIVVVLEQKGQWMD